MLYLVEQGFKMNDISVMFGCCRRTIERKVKMHGISQYNGSQISDLELNNIICEISAMFRRNREKSVSGRFRSKGIFSSK